MKSELVATSIYLIIIPDFIDVSFMPSTFPPEPNFVNIG